MNTLIDARNDPAVVTGLGVVSPLGCGRETFWRALCEGRDGIGPVQRFSTGGYAATLAASVPGGHWDALRRENERGEGPDPCAEMAIDAAREAWQHAGLSLTPALGQVALVLGTSTGGLWSRSCYELSPHSAGELRSRLLGRSSLEVQTRAVADALGLTGPRVTVSTACASATHALCHARDLIAAGLVEVALVGGADALFEETFAGFHALGAMSPAPCAPFSEPVGMNLGEGAGFLVLERSSRARARGARALVQVLGYGLSCDVYHATSPDPSGSAVARAVTSALVDAGVTAAEVGYYNAHGTGTEANDAAEARGLARALGDRGPDVPVSSTKSYFGHALGAAGALELIATALALDAGVVLPTLHFTRPRGDLPPDVVPEARPRPHAYSVALKGNAAFAGANAVVAVASPSFVRAEPRAPRRAAVRVIGAGVVAAHGTDDFDAALRAGSAFATRTEESARGLPVPYAAHRVGPFALTELARGVDPRTLDAMGRYVTASVALALRDAGVRARGALRDRAGVVLQAGSLSWDTADEFWGSLRTRGFPRASASAFARVVLNAPAGAAARALSLRGPLSVLVGLGSALGAVALARWMLCTREDADLLCVVGASHLGPGALEDHAFVHPETAAPCDPGALRAVYAPGAPGPLPGEGSACVALAADRDVPELPSRTLARVTGCGVAGRDALPEALARALGEASLDARDLDAVYGSANGDPDAGRRELAALRAALGDDLGGAALCNPAPAVGRTNINDAFALAAAVEALRTGRAHPPCDGRRGGAGSKPARRVAVVSTANDTGSAAVILEGDGG